MFVSIALEHPHEHYTNLDVIQGKVALRVPNPTNVSSIVVKLEGESRTRLLAPIHPNRPDKQRPVLEIHKFLYRTQVVWPEHARPEDLVNNPKASFTINAGSFEYPFQFKIPLNTSCQQTNSPISTVSFSNAIPEFAKTPTQHIKATLPPSLSGFPGEAEIRYFVKVTVNRPQFFKENPRSTANFTFLPIEPPRPEKADGEAYARRQHQFLENAPMVAADKKAGFFDRKSSTNSPPKSPTTGSVPPRVTIDARLPNPAVLTSNQDIPLRLLVKNVSERAKNIYLQMLQIQLIGYTKVRAHEVARTESNSWILCSFSNMAIPIGSPTDAVDTEVPINAEYWSGKPIPNTVPPTFTTCNLSRFYEVEVRVGIGYGSYKHGEDQLVVLSLRLPVKVYSGIAPPMALLEASLTGEPGKLNPPTLNVPPTQQQPPHTPTTPTHGGFGNSGGGFSGQPVQPQAAAPGYDEAPPPSYEEAIGHDLPPINGYRGSYQPPPVPDDAPSLSGEKRR
ncbi:arrestin [Cucurbitaria berberidis CBS 394.84]|uniref:Arrestin n=1 Tax=Cucurbitaria berberidis CBS 394.84 TaxID=1168544 RepID=A0A9P4GTM4_9PLEO|nr:arrestin [Cucurbitaria berberidis CBS 394.84]KAF1851582.1 arrestin [Cucurbitaria berberidis CBS 394.84]